jgi:predicted solute-binding protein
VRLLIDDTFATSTYTTPITLGWVTPPDGVAIELTHGLAATQIGEADVALTPASVILPLHQTHQIMPSIAVIANGVGAVAMRTPVRPDEIEKTPVRLLDSDGAELLARATLRPFYGIEPTSWLREENAPDTARAEVVIVSGAEALREPEAGYSEDLGRAWFILTSLPVVSHVLLLPQGMTTPERQFIFTFLDGAKTEGLARRREWRTALAEREGIARNRAGAFWGAQRLKLDVSDRQALRELLRLGSPKEYAPLATGVPFIDGADSA